MSEHSPPTVGVLRIPGFAAFWVAGTISGFGSYVTTMAIQVLVVTTLAATPVEIGAINAVRFLPYLLLGLVAGGLVDGWRRKPTLVVSGLARCVLLLAIPTLWALDWLTLWALGVLLFLFGTMTLFADAAAQSFLPRLVPRAHLLAANARLDQSATVAQTSGPVIGGALVSVVGAPLAVIVDAFTYAIEAMLIGRIRVDEPPATRRRPARHLLRDVREGIRFTYRHPTLAPLAWSTHVWFLANSIALTVFAPFALRSLGLSALQYGITLALAGLGGLLGASLAPRIGNRIGAGHAVLAGRALIPVAWVVIAIAPSSATYGPVLTVAILAAGQAVYGFSMGIENANEMGYRQSVTPDEMQGRMNATMRSANRTMVVVGSLVGGLLAATVGYRPALWLCVIAFLLAAAMLGFSPFRRAQHGDVPVPISSR